MTWLDALDERQQKEVKLARLYATQEFSHGTTGHADLLLIARLADLLDQAHGQLQLARAGGTVPPPDTADPVPAIVDWTKIDPRQE